jgi:hypothetical protein
MPQICFNYCNKIQSYLRSPAMSDGPLCLRCTYEFNMHEVSRVSLAGCDYGDEIYNLLFSILAATKGATVETVISK